MKVTKIFFLVAVAASLGRQASAQNYDTNGEVVQTFAGSGFTGYLDGVGQQTMFRYPAAMVADSLSNLFVWDSNNYRIRKIAPDGTVTTFAGCGSNDQGTGTNVNFANNLVLTIDRNNTICGKPPFVDPSAMRDLVHGFKVSALACAGRGVAPTEARQRAANTAGARYSSDECGLASL